MNIITCTLNIIGYEYDYSGGCFVCSSLWLLQLAGGNSTNWATEGDTIVFERLKKLFWSISPFVWQPVIAKANTGISVFLQKYTLLLQLLVQWLHWECYIGRGFAFNYRSLAWHQEKYQPFYVVEPWGLYQNGWIRPNLHPVTNWINIKVNNNGGACQRDPFIYDYSHYHWWELLSADAGF